MNGDLYFSLDGSQMGVRAEIVIFGPHSTMKPGRYSVHIQIPNRNSSATDGLVFGFDHILRAAVVDDFGTLVGVPS